MNDRVVFAAIMSTPFFILGLVLLLASLEMKLDEEAGPSVKHGSRSGYRKGCRCVRCTGWKRDYERDLRARQRAAGGPVAPINRMGVFPVEPFERALFREGRSVKSLPERLQRALYRARNSGGCSVQVADDLACIIGKHPCQIWDSWFVEDVSA